MKIAICLACAIATLPALSAAEPNLLARNAQEAAETLPRGCIVIAEQNGGEAATFAVAGKQEPAAIPPEKVIFEIGSISKVFTGILLAQAIIEKKVTLDTTLRELMGSARAFADKNVAAITLRQLATHTSGLPRLPDNMPTESGTVDPYARYDRAHLDAFVAKAKLAHAPPFESDYSNLGVGLLGDLLARLYGKNWEDLVAERIARPLGLTDTCVALNQEQKSRLAPPYSGDQRVKTWHFIALAGAGALHSTAADLLRFGQALARPETTPLKEAIATTEQRINGGSIGLCLQILKVGDRDAYWFAGGTGGYRSWISARPADGRIVAMLINNGALSPGDILNGKTPPAAAASSPEPADPELSAYAGQYDTGVKAGGASIFYTFEARGSDLWMQITGQPFIKLSRLSATNDRFEFKPVKAEIQFKREKGDVVSTTLFQSGLEIKAKKLPSSGLTKP